MKETWVIGVGGAAGALLRYGVNLAFEATFFPFGTLLINTLGTFILGALTSYASKKQMNKQLFLMLGTGACGGFTTMSTFAAESVKMLTTALGIGLLYMITTLFLGLLAGFIGLSLFPRSKGDQI